jgi:hypothetical protein
LGGARGFEIMSILIFFGGVSIVIIIGIAVLIGGVRYHYLQYKSGKKD